jgi:hypothetical protein
MERSRRDGSGAVTTAPSGTGPTPPSAPCAGNIYQFKTNKKALLRIRNRLYGSGPDLDPPINKQKNVLKKP